jgi:uncharacterized C2H2 Zn-finger protein
MRTLVVSVVLWTLVGCGAQPQSGSPQGSGSSASGSPAGGGTDAVHAAAPRPIDTLTDQTQVYECPRCGMDYAAAGKCSMDGAELVATRVQYICPADNKPVERAGKCPRCAANARVEKTAMAETKSDASGN